MANPANILLVEDNYETCQLVKKILTRPNQNFQCRFDTASTLSGAIRQLHKKPYDNILLDLGLPDSDGIETIEKIHHTSPDTPIVVFTCRDDIEMELESMGRGAEDYFVKGTDTWDKLLPRIRYAIENKRAIEGLTRSYKHFKSVIKNSRSAVIYISPQGQILEFNSKAEQLFNCEREDVLSKNFFARFVLDDDRNNLSMDIQKALSGGLTKNSRTTVTLLDGNRYSLFWNLDDLDTDQKDSTSVIAIAHAISQKTPIRNDFFLIPSLAYNPNFEDTVNMVLNSLSEIMVKIDDTVGFADEDSLKPLTESLDKQKDDHNQITKKRNAAVKRLALSLVKAG